MKVKIKIKTPEQCAKNTLLKLQALLGLANRKVKLEGWVNKKDDTIYIEAEGEPRKIMRIEQNIKTFSDTTTALVTRKDSRAALKKIGATEEQLDELKKIFKDNTEMTIVKEATAQEIVEGNMSLWDRMKKTFKRLKL